jgi:hypothetical protein
VLFTLSQLFRSALLLDELLGTGHSGHAGTLPSNGSRT